MRSYFFLLQALALVALRGAKALGDARHPALACASDTKSLSQKAFQHSRKEK